MEETPNALCALGLDDRLKEEYDFEEYGKIGSQ
jgi:hypothetical protein